MSDMENIVPIDEKEPSPEQVLVNKEQRSAVVEWVSELPDREQELIRLKLQNGMSYKEISNVTGLSVSNVGFILHTAMTSLRQRAAVMAGN